MDDDFPPDNYYQFNSLIIRSDPPLANMNEMPPDNYYEFNSLIIRSAPPLTHMYNDLPPKHLLEMVNQCLIRSDPPRTKALADKELIRACRKERCNVCCRISVKEIANISVNISSVESAASTSTTTSTSVARKRHTTPSKRRESASSSKRTRQNKMKEVLEREQHRASPAVLSKTNAEPKQTRKKYTRKTKTQKAAIPYYKEKLAINNVKVKKCRDTKNARDLEMLKRVHYLQELIKKLRAMLETKTDLKQRATIAALLEACRVDEIELTKKERKKLGLSVNVTS